MVNHPHRKRRGASLDSKAGLFQPIIHAWKEKPREGTLIEPYASLDQPHHIRIDPYWNGFLYDCLMTIRMSIERHSLAFHHHEIRKLFRNASLDRQAVETGRCGDYNFLHHVSLNASGELTIERIRITEADFINDGTIIHLIIPRFVELCDKIRKQDWVITTERESESGLVGIA